MRAPRGGGVRFSAVAVAGAHVRHVRTRPANILARFCEVCLAPDNLCPSSSMACMPCARTLGAQERPLQRCRADHWQHRQLPCPQRHLAKRGTSSFGDVNTVAELLPRTPRVVFLARGLFLAGHGSQAARHGFGPGYGHHVYTWIHVAVHRGPARFGSTCLTKSVARRGAAAAATRVPHR